MSKEIQVMKLAIKLAKQANPYPNPRVGAVLIKDGQMIGLGYHKKAGTNHAEIEAIEDAKKRGNENLIKGSTLYVTLEPCVHDKKRTTPCTQRIIQEGIAKVVFGMVDPNPFVSSKGIELLGREGIEIIGPILEEKCKVINKKYISNIEKKPFVILKMAASMDGKTATKAGDSKWITSEKSRTLVHKLRSEVDAIMIGSGTVIADNPHLTARLAKGNDPYRIIIDGKLQIPISSNILQNKDGKTIIITSENAPKRPEIKTRIIVCGKDKVDLPKAVDILSAMGMKRILIEGGCTLAGLAIEASIVDKIYLFLAPIIIGGQNAKSIIGASGVELVKDAVKLQKIKIKKIGQDTLIIADIKK
ncbi:MAG: bifunctional diaminohydroxyphosphoribosylaminopyrimidine deaminase/5-amino-6-(5-phosphoribosylamino)uracil reductase RibD [Candidatus Bilamarchaeum sp.]